jgi:cystathionine beta-lyase/cystathionine gamma-synthase
MDLSTRLIHKNNIENKEKAVVPPLFSSTTFERGESGTDFPGGYIYSRYNNPNRQILEEKIAAMEEGTACISFASGMAAANAVFQSLKCGDHIIMPDDTYFAVKHLLDLVFSRLGISYTTGKCKSTNQKRNQTDLDRNTFQSSSKNHRHSSDCEDSPRKQLHHSS